MLNTSRVLLLKRQQTTLNTSAPIPIVECKLTIVQVLLYRLRNAAASLSMILLLLESVVVVAAGIHRLLLDLCELRVVRILKYRFDTAIVDKVAAGVLDVTQVHPSHVLVSDLIGGQVVICIVP